jgi:hypothetical protein
MLEVTALFGPLLDKVGRAGGRSADQRNNGDGENGTEQRSIEV